MIVMVLVLVCSKFVECLPCLFLADERGKRENVVVITDGQPGNRRASNGTTNTRVPCAEIIVHG